MKIYRINFYRLIDNRLDKVYIKAKSMYSAIKIFRLRYGKDIFIKDVFEIH